ncbi:Centrobin [Orchesella cincta]|uniref:Centrobin n=1 Tax=Orchesella cincta TaxID=48709 RepID=A0A1D2MV45_ORCCI|nr:Centrobin [Orchesella cincta]
MDATAINELMNKGTSSGSSNPIIVSKSDVVLGGAKASTFKRRVIKKAASKFRGMTSSRSPKEIMEGTVGRDTVPVESIASDLEKILSEYELPAEELEALINNLDDEDIDLTAVEFIENDEVDGNFVDALSQLKLNEWSNDESYNEMYHAEKFKREQCEKELNFLQQSVLAEKQQNAVLEGTLKRRNMMLVQITMAFNRVCKEWKKFDSESKATVNKLQHDQKVLAAACKHSKERISQYEKELHKTVELADSFKGKLVDVQTERDESVQTLKKVNHELEERIAKLKEDMEMLRNERDATLRALRESQIRLDEGKISFEKMEAHLKALEEKGNESCQKYEELLQAKTQQESSYMEVVARQKELETLVMNLTIELNHEKSSKDQLKKDMQEETERKTRAEAERLHEYYNKKVQEILKSATEEAARAESLLKDQIKRAAVESERKLTECKERFQREMDMLKAKYEAEIERLKRENLHKQLLISSTVKQLQMGDSPNLEINSLNMPSRTPYQKEGFDSLKGQHSKDSCGSHSKSGYSQFTKFTLDHIPQSVIVPSAHHNMENTQESTKSLYDDIPFEAGKILARFKTSTPLDSHVPRNHNDGAAGDSRSVKSSTSGHGDAPTTLIEKPEKEQHQMKYICSNDKHPETPLDPTLQKCIQELLKSYADKFQPEVRNGSSVSTDVPANNNAQEYINDFNNKNDGGSSSCNNDNDRLPCSSTSESHTNSSRCESHKTKGKVEINTSKIQPPSQGKPPWK